MYQLPDDAPSSRSSSVATSPLTPIDTPAGGNLCLPRSPYAQMAVSAANGEFQLFHGVKCMPAVLMGPLLEISDPDWREQIDVNSSGAAYVLRVFGPLLVSRGGGASLSPRHTGPTWNDVRVGVLACKWRLIGLMRSAALELGAHDITANGVDQDRVDSYRGPLHPSYPRRQWRHAWRYQLAGE
jgi:NAD(P)-dependent dehydrogenase (short-subunit alcohol dehydrogenase family)